MQDLIVVGFHNQYRAAEVLNELWRMDEDWVVDLDDAVAVYRDRHGKLRYQQSVTPTAGEGAGWGLLWGSLIGGLLAAPFTAGASAAVGAAAVATGLLAGGAIGAAGGALDAKWWKEDFGISDEFIKGVSDMIEPGDSAIFAYIRSSDPEMVAKRFRGYGGQVLRSTLTPQQAAKLEDVLHSRV
jgi:uncharacterized membrane protein